MNFNLIRILYVFLVSSSIMYFKHSAQINLPKICCISFALENHTDFKIEF